jgi:putative toxin-antitoxin system antitoxin component (TIGR02293 family)
MATISSGGSKLSIRTRFKKFDVSNLHTIVFSARKGLNPKIFYSFAETIKMPEKTLADILNISARTVNNYREQQKVLEPVYSEHLLKLIALYSKGEEIFGNIDEFNYWLGKPLWNTKDIPINWTRTPGGVDLLIEELDKLAQGYPI